MVLQLSYRYTIYNSPTSRFLSVGLNILSIGIIQEVFGLKYKCFWYYMQKLTIRQTGQIVQ